VGGQCKDPKEKISHTHKPMQLAAHVLYNKIKKIMNNKNPSYPTHVVINICVPFFLGGVLQRNPLSVSKKI
jgi:hypothetical protein